MSDSSSVSVIWARRSAWGREIEIVMGVETSDGVRPIRSAGLEVLEIGAIPQPVLSLSITEAQALMDQLWDCGLRPSKGSGSAGALLATQKHLNDMRALVFKREGEF